MLPPQAVNRASALIEIKPWRWMKRGMDMKRSP
jgi:hypothetical protein